MTSTIIIIIIVKINTILKQVFKIIKNCMLESSSVYLEQL